MHTRGVFQIWSFSHNQKPKNGPKTPCLLPKGLEGALPESWRFFGGSVCEGLKERCVNHGGILAKQPMWSGLMGWGSTREYNFSSKNTKISHFF